MCQSSSAAHSRPFEISHSRKTVEFFHPKAAIIHAHSAKPILNQNNQTNLTRYVSLSRVSSYPIRSPTATLYQKKPTRVFGRLWKLFLPEARSHHLRFVASTSCHPLIFFARNFVKFVKCVYSRGPCVRGVCGSAGGAEGQGVPFTHGVVPVSLNTP